MAKGNVIDVSLALRAEFYPPTGEPDSYIQEHEGQLRAVGEGADYDVGWVRFFVIDMKGASHAHTMFDLFDDRIETFCYTQLLDGHWVDDEGSEFSETVMQMVPGLRRCGENILVIDRIEVSPEFRGHYYALHAIELAVMRLGQGCRLAVMKPYPLQFEAGRSDPGERRKSLALEALKGSQASATRKLMDYYRQVGFQHVPETELMLRDLGKRWKGKLPRTQAVEDGDE